MRILNVQLKHTHGGNPQVAIDYTRVLKAAGNYVTVLTNPQDPFLDKHQEIADHVIAAKHLGKHGSYDLCAILYFRKIIKDTKPDIIIAHEGRSAALMRRAAAKTIKVIDANHGRSPKQSRAMDASIVTSKYQIENYRQMLGENFPAYYVPNSMNLAQLEKPNLPKNWHSPPVIGTIGRFVKDKALDIFIEACAILQNKDLDFVVKMAGEGEERASLELQVAQNNLQDKFQMNGWVKNPDQFYEEIDIFCFPSRKEEFGLVLLEAYKHGLPAVVSDASGPSDIVEAGIDALMVPKENANLLADALQELLENKTKADQLAAAGYDKLISQYDVPQVAKILQGVLEEVGGNKFQNESIKEEAI